MTQSMFDEYCCKKTAMAPILIAAGSCSKLIYIYIYINFWDCSARVGTAAILIRTMDIIDKKELAFECTKHYKV